MYATTKRKRKARTEREFLLERLGRHGEKTREVRQHKAKRDFLPLVGRYVIFREPPRSREQIVPANKRTPGLGLHFFFMRIKAN